MIVTHTNPDFDAITGVWLLKRFGGLEHHSVEFVNTGNPDTEILNRAGAVVDTGQGFDPDDLRFDHHHLEGQLANDTCAALQVFEYLKGYVDIEYLESLVNLVFAGDTGRSDADSSRELGLHAMLSGYKMWFREQNPDAPLEDNLILTYGMGLLDTLEIKLRKQAETRIELEEKVVYRSDDNLVWAIKHGSSGSTFAAYEGGARVVVFEGEPFEVEGGITYSIGLTRSGEWREPHVGKLVDIIANIDEYTDEINTWFKHPAGFFAGRGTAKAPVFEPVEIDLAGLASKVDAAWRR